MVSDGYTDEDHEGWGVPALCVGQGSDKGLCMNCLSPKKKNWCLLCEIDFIRRACVITITYVTYVALAKNLHVVGHLPFSRPLWIRPWLCLTSCDRSTIGLCPNGCHIESSLHLIRPLKSTVPDSCL